MKQLEQHVDELQHENEEQATNFTELHKVYLENKGNWFNLMYWDQKIV